MVSLAAAVVGSAAIRRYSGAWIAIRRPIVPWRHYINGSDILLTAIVLLVLVCAVTGWNP